MLNKHEIRSERPPTVSKKNVFGVSALLDFVFGIKIMLRAALRVQIKKSWAVYLAQKTAFIKKKSPEMGKNRKNVEKARNPIREAAHRI